MGKCLSIFALLGAAEAFAAGHGESTDAVTSTVRVDRRTGRLVRQVVVPERVIESRVIAPQDAEGGAAKASVKTADARIDSVVEEVAGQYKVDPLLVHAMIHVESRYNKYAVSPKGAEGLMQLIPSTARRMGVRNSFDTRQNVEGGVKYLKQLQDRFGDLRYALAAYNAGENAVERHRGIPPYAETQEYVYQVGRRYGDLRRAQPRTVAKTAAVVPEPTAPTAAVYSPVESYVDPEGRLSLKTR
jgi:soluble lytic murein transglycosylase-like protein